MRGYDVLTSYRKANLRRRANSNIIYDIEAEPVLCSLLLLKTNYQIQLKLFLTDVDPVVVVCFNNSTDTI